MPLIFFCGGAAALAWQVLWAHHLGLALGASARGVALTVATAMAGMTLGSILAARLLRDRTPSQPLVWYGALEALIGLSALVPGIVEPGIMAMDSWIHRQLPGAATPFTVLALAFSIGPACLAMGATLPVLGLIAQARQRPLSRFYACNTAGAASGVLLAAFALIPQAGLRGSAYSLVALHLILALACIGMARAQGSSPSRLPEEGGGAAPRGAWLLAFLSGMAAFMLEVSWFRSLRSAWFSTSDSFAIMLSCFLIALAVGAALAPLWKRRGGRLDGILAAAALGVVLATSCLGRFDLVEAFQAKGAWRQLSRLFAGLGGIGPPVALLGMLLPTLLDSVRRPRDWAAFYALNTLGAVIGANLVAWLLLEWIGPIFSAWMAAGLLSLGAWTVAETRSRRQYALAVFLLALVLGLWLERGQWRRVPGAERSFPGEIELVERRHGPDASIAVVAYEGGRALFIDGFATTAESRAGEGRGADPRFHYMEAMGRVPMLLHPDPRDALVICFGTGQTAHAVRDEGVQHLDLADLSPAVFALGHHFASNQGVLDDARVRTLAMDGRAWLRRTEQAYDVVTLEPMPPFFSGSNALYSREFYALVHERLRPGGLLAQWFPLHLMTPDQAASIAAAFVEVFPESILWMDPASLSAGGVPDQGILLGRKSGESAGGPRFGEEWPGYGRAPESGSRPLSAAQARAQVALEPEALRRFVAGAVPVSDDNQLLEYGGSPYRESQRVSASILEIHRRLAEARSALPDP